MIKRLLLMGLLATVGWAQELPQFNAPTPGREQLLKMGYPGFSEWANEHASLNEVQADSVAAWYARIRLDADKPLLKDKPGLVQAMKDLNAWNELYYEALYLYMGGGTMYSHAASRSVASLADVEAEAIQAWRKAPGKSPAGHTFAQQHPDWNKIDHNQAELKKAITREGVAYQKALASLKKLPGGAREVLARYLADTSGSRWGEN
ncbi:hypothetical protein JST97_02000 [bacterium]|nr:hypothetical protein [bacterium]